MKALRIGVCPGPGRSWSNWPAVRWAKVTAETGDVPVAAVLGRYRVAAAPRRRGRRGRLSRLRPGAPRPRVPGLGGGAGPARAGLPPGRGAGPVGAGRRPDPPAPARRGRGRPDADPGRLAVREAALRSALALPPETAVALVSGAGADSFVQQLAGVEVLGPARGRWLVKAPGHRVLSDALAAAARPVGERLRVEVDPLRL